MLSKYNERRLYHGQIRAQDIAKFFGWELVGFGYVLEGMSFRRDPHQTRRFDLDFRAADALLAYVYRMTRKPFFDGEDMIRLIDYTHSDEELAFVAAWLAKHRLPVLIENIDRARKARYGGGPVKRR